MKRAVLCFLFLLAAVPVFAQTYSRYDGVTSGGRGPLAGVSVAVCSQPAVTTTAPCSPLASLFSTSSGTAKANPLTSDGLGNFSFYAPAGLYTLQYYGSSITTTVFPDVQVGNLATAVNAAQTGQAGAVQIGPVWYPGTATGFVANPTTAPTVTNDSTTAGSIGNGTYYCVDTFGNVNGETLAGPQTSIVINNGTGTNTIGVALNNDFGPNTGAYKMRVYCGTVSGGPYYLQTPWTVTAAIAAAGCSITSNVATCLANTPTSAQTVPSTFPITIGTPVIVASVGNGAGGAVFNGTFTVTTVGYSAGTGVNTFSYALVHTNDTSTGTGTMGAFTGIETNWHYVRGVVILSTIAGSGSNPPVTNTATIDPIQVAINAARCNTTDFNARCGTVKLTGIKYQLTTPIILSNTPPALWGEAPEIDISSIDGGANPRSTQLLAAAGWPSSVGVIMDMGTSMDIRNMLLLCSASSNGLMFINASNAVTRKGVEIDCSGSSGHAEHIQTGISGFNWQFDGVQDTGGSNSTVYYANSSIGHMVFNQGRVNCPSNSGNSHAFQFAGGPTDFDRQVNFSGIPSSPDVTIKEIDFESCYNAYIQVGAGRLILDHMSMSDPRTVAGTNGANIEVIDEPYSPGATQGIEVRNQSILVGSTNANAGTWMNAHSGGPPLICGENSSFGSGASSVSINFNNFQGQFVSNGCSLDPTTGIINLAMAGNNIPARTSLGSVGCGFSSKGCNDLSGNLRIWQIAGVGNFKNFRVQSNTLNIYATDDTTNLFSLDNSGNVVATAKLGFGSQTAANQFQHTGTCTGGPCVITWPNAVAITPAVLSVAQNWTAIQNFQSGFQLNGATTITAQSGTGGTVCMTISCVMTTPTLGAAGFTTLTSATANPATTGAIRLANSDAFCWRNEANSANLCFTKNSLDAVVFPSAANFTAYQTATNCSSSASPAVCGSAAAGSVALPTGAVPTLQVNTTAVTANSLIFLNVDESLGTKLSVTCNTTLSTLLNPVVTARSAGASFTFTINATIAVNPACISYFIVN